MAGIEDLLGAGSVARQFLFWGVLYEAIRNLMAPYFQAELNKVNAQHQVVPLSPADLADMVLRGRIDLAFGQDEAKKSGVSPDNFTKLFHNVGEPPGLEFVLQAFRRGFIPWDAPTLEPSVLEAVRTSRLVTGTWSEPINKMLWAPIPVADSVDAVVENQIPYAEGEKIAGYNGINPESFKILFNTRGRPVSPSEAIDLFHRGVIPIRGTGPDALTFEQAIFESAVKDKWERPLEHLIDRYPSAFEIIALANAGAIDKDTEGKVLTILGFTPDVIAAFLAHNGAVKTAGSKSLAQGTVLQLYRDRLIDTPTAEGMLGDLGLDKTDADFALAVEDMARIQTNLNAAISKVRAQYVAAKIDKQTASDALAQLRVPAAQVTALLDEWDVELAVNVKVLTQAEIRDAWKENIIDQATAQAALEGIGYSAVDAWILLSITNKGPLPGQPTG